MKHITLHEKQVEDEVKKTLASLEGIGNTQPQPYFYTRLKARMETELMQPKQILIWQLRPIYAFSVLLMVLIINAFTISLVQKNSHSQALSQQRVYTHYSATNF